MPRRARVGPVSCSSTATARLTGCDGDPVLGPARDAGPLVGGAVDTMTFHDTVGAARDGMAATAHRLDLAVTHARQISTDDVAGRLKPLLLANEALLVEAMRTPWRAGQCVD